MFNDRSPQSTNPQPGEDVDEQVVRGQASVRSDSPHAGEFAAGSSSQSHSRPRPTYSPNAPEDHPPPQQGGSEWRPDLYPSHGPYHTARPPYDPSLMNLGPDQSTIPSSYRPYPIEPLPPNQYPVNSAPPHPEYPYPPQMFDFSAYPNYPDLSSSSGPPPPQRLNRDWQMMPTYPYPPPLEAPNPDPNERTPKMGDGSESWPGMAYGAPRQAVASGSGHSQRAPNTSDPAYDPYHYPPSDRLPPLGQYPTPSATVDATDPALRSPRPSTSTSGLSVTSPIGPRTRQSRARRKSSSLRVDEDEEDEEDGSASPEQAETKLNKRRGQNKMAQRAFRARSRVQNAKVSTEMATLTELTQTQAKRLEDMTALVATLQQENHQLRTAALSRQPVHTTQYVDPRASQSGQSNQPPAGLPEGVAADTQGDSSHPGPDAPLEPHPE